MGVMDPGLQRALRLAEEWADQWRLCFSPQKCECICFCATNVHIQRTFAAQLYGEALPHVHSLRYLGVWFDEHLTWDQHVREAVARARGRLWELRRCVGIEWGVHPPWFLRVVRGAILPTLFYGAPCWAAVLSSSGRLAQLDGVLALAGRLAFGLECTTSGEACRMLAGLFQLDSTLCRALFVTCGVSISQYFGWHHFLKCLSTMSHPKSWGGHGSFKPSEDTHLSLHYHGEGD